jgi:hypothetical protein
MNTETKVIKTKLGLPLDFLMATEFRSTPDTTVQL